MVFGAISTCEIRIFGYIGVLFSESSSPTKICRNAVQIETVRCAKSPSNMGPFVMIFGGLLILGVGRTMPHSLGLPLIDDNVQRRNLPVYFGRFIP
ncbi:unnamed protein product [Gongylonema pulchrum]|uniref:Aa_trans domain-containing protein n=1 Tax=Gongylonema pulchrum TaxID=637853 RepID=A0A183DG75_9BILA|nr:unnamed protein product [Gongylonema pulchrum]